VEQTIGHVSDDLGVLRFNQSVRCRGSLGSIDENMTSEQMERELEK
jgi:hypothetical protein